MEAQPGLMASILAQKDVGQAEAFEAFRQHIDTALADGALRYWHGAAHWRNVEVYAVRLVPEKVFQQIPAAEVRVMAAACTAHDLQPADGKGYAWLTEDAPRWGLDGAFAPAVRRVCEALEAGVDRLRRVPRWIYLERDAADLRRVAAALLLADRIDLEHSDCPLPPVIDDIPPEKAAAWPHERGLSIGLIDPREGVLRLDMVANNREWRRQIEEFFMPHVQAAMEAARNLLLVDGMPYREIELHDLHAKPTADMARAKELMRARAGARRRPEKPFKLLEPYEEDEGHLLSARDEDILRLAGRVLSSPLTVLTGEAGVGKTSLVQAGLLPWLREQGYDGVCARCLNDPSQAILDAIRKRVGPAAEGLVLPEALDLLSATVEPPVVVVLDQCQELFTRLGSLTRLEFAHDLASLLSLADDRVHALLAIQDDFLVRMVELLPALPTLLHEVVRLSRLTREQGLLVIDRSLGRFRERFEQLVRTHLVDDLCTSEGVLPVELQICCEVLYNSREEEERYIGFDLYRRLGPAQRIVEGLLDGRLRQLRWRRQALAKNILVNCVTGERTKTLITVDECAVDIGSDADTTQEIIDELVQLGLLRGIQLGQTMAYELSHGYLARRLEPWISDVALEAKDVDDLLHRELNNYEKFQIPLDREKLRLIHQYRRRLTLTPDELDLAIRSAAKERFEVDYWFGRVNELSVSQQMVLCVDLLYSPEPDLRDSLRLMVSRLDHKAVLPTLLASLREADEQVRDTAIEVLREINTNLVTALEQGDAETQQQAAYALGQIGARHAVPTLVESAQHAPRKVREQAIEALAEIDRGRAADLLIRSLRSGSQRSRWNAALALGRLGRDAEVRERLRRETERRDAGEPLVFAYARACIEGHAFEEAERVLHDLDRRSVPEDQRHRLVTAREQLNALQEQAQKGLFIWPMSGGGPGGAACARGTLRVPLELKWEFATGDLVYGSPVVANEMVYIGSTDRHLYALDADSGAQRWRYDAEAELRGSPCVIDGSVIIGGLDGRVHAVDAATGRRLWQKAFGGQITCSIRGDQERLILGTSDSSVVAFAPRDGRELWRTQLSGGVTTNPAVEQGLVAIGVADLGLVMLDAASGDQLWCWHVEGGLTVSPALVRGRVVIGTVDGRVEVLGVDGEVFWSNFVGNGVGSPAAVAGERIFIGGTDGEVASFDLATGRCVWTFDTDGEVTASPTVAGGTVFVGSQSGRLFALRAETGQPLWSHRTGYSIYSTPAVASNRLFVALRYYNVSAFAEPVEVEEV